MGGAQDARALIGEARPIAAPAAPDFSLMGGGLLCQIFRRVHLSGKSPRCLGRRTLVVTLVAWLPLLVLSAVDGSLRARAIGIPFLADIEAHVRFLVSLPLLIVAEVIVNTRISPLIRRFVDGRLVATEDLPAFDAAVRSITRACNSTAFEVAQLALVYTGGLWLWRTQLAPDAATWLAGRGAGFGFTRAGYWYAFVSIPIFQFILLRWYARLVLWFTFLWRMSRLNLHLSAAHPDRAGGLGFLGENVYAFSPMLFAQGALLSGLIASRVMYSGQSMGSFGMEVVVLVVALVLFILGPLVMFTPQLDRARQKGRAEYGVLANRYVFLFEEKWTSRSARATADPLGSSDIQSLADLGNSFAIVRDMRVVPFRRDDVIILVAAAAAPFLPLPLTMFSLQDSLARLLKLLL